MSQWFAVQTNSMPPQTLTTVAAPKNRKISGS
ncbi:MAG: hypothetical protein RLZ98_281 [Pseudomonadota bacterium]